MQQRLKPIALNQPRRQLEAAAAETERQVTYIGTLVFALQLRQVGALVHVEGDVDQIDLCHPALQFGRAHAAGI